MRSEELVEGKDRKGSTRGSTVADAAFKLWRSGVNERGDVRCGRRQLGVQNSVDDHWSRRWKSCEDGWWQQPRTVHISPDPISFRSQSRCILCPLCLGEMPRRRARAVRGAVQINELGAFSPSSHV